MLRLLASAPEDGWAIVRSTEGLVLVRPPYQRPVPVDDTVAQRCVEQAGFVVEDQPFADWSALLAHLKRQIVEVRRKRGQGAPDAEQIRNLVHDAPRDVLESLLDRVDGEWLPQRHWKPAMDLLVRLLRVDTVRDETQLRERVLALLIRCQQEAAGAEEQKQALVDPLQILQGFFPHAVARHRPQAIQHLALGIRQRHSAFAPA